MRESHVTDEVRVDGVFGMRLAGVRPWHGAFEPHEAHKSLNALAVDGIALAPEPLSHLARAEEGRAQVLLVDKAHEPQVLRALPARRVIVAGAGQPEKIALANDGKPRMVWFDEHTPIHP